MRGCGIGPLDQLAANLGEMIVAPDRRETKIERRDLMLVLVLFALSLVAYLRTMQRTFGWSDSSELTTAAYYLGIGHSPGYPTWMLIAYPFAHLPIGEVAFRLNLMNALLGALAVALVYLTYYLIATHRAAAFVGALAFAFSATFWDVTTEADVFTLHVVLAAAILVVALWWRRAGARRDGRADRRLYLLSWLVGVSLGNHALIALMIPALVYLIWAEQGLGFFLHRRTVACLGLFLLGLSVYALLPIRGMSNSPPHLSNPHSLADLWAQLTAPGARQSMFEASPLIALHRAGANLWRLTSEFGYAGCALALVGLGVLWRRDRRLAVFLLLIGAVDVAYACNFSIFDIYSYYLPLHLVWAALIAVGAAVALELAAKATARIPGTNAALTPARGRGLAAALLLALPFTLFTGHLAIVDGSDRFDAELFARAVMRQVEPGALILADWYTVAPLGYLKYVEGVRSDVTLSAAPSNPTEAQFNAAVTPDLVARYPAAYFVEKLTYRARSLRARGFYLVPEGPVSRLLADRPPPETLLARIPSRPQARFGSQIGLVRADTRASPPGDARLVTHDTLGPGEALGFTVYWTPLPGYDRRRYEAIFMLENQASGRVWQEIVLLGHDLYPFEGWRQGQVLREQHYIYLSEPSPPGEYDLLVRLRPHGESACLRCDQAVPGRQGRDYRLARVTVRAAGR